MYKYLFGPVPSRRLGVSLGIDLIPYKTCSFNCQYCECGQTTNHTAQRQTFVKFEKIIDELKDFMSKNPEPDYITFSGSGEPTLYRDLGMLSGAIKKLFPNTKLALLTNSSLLFDEEVMEDISECDIILPSIDTLIEDEFLILDKPAESITLDKIKKGFYNLRDNFDGKVWVEIFFAKGINDSKKNINDLYDFLHEIDPDKIQLNTLDRPPAIEGIKPVSKEFLQEIVDTWNDLDVEIISKFKQRKQIKSYNNNLEETIIETIKRRPVTLEDLENITGLKRMEINKYLDILESENKIKSKIIENQVFITFLKQ